MDNITSQVNIDDMLPKHDPRDAAASQLKDINVRLSAPKLPPTVVHVSDDNEKAANRVLAFPTGNRDECIAKLKRMNFKPDEATNIADLIDARDRFVSSNNPGIPRNTLFKSISLASLPGLRAHGMEGYSSMMPWSQDASSNAQTDAAAEDIIMTPPKNPKPTAMLHELGHAFNWDMQAVSPEMADTMNRIYGIKENPNSDDKGGDQLSQWSGEKTAYTNQPTERFAQDFSHYVSQDKAPTPELVPVFNAFAKYITNWAQTRASNTLRDQGVDMSDTDAGSQQRIKDQVHKDIPAHITKLFWGVRDTPEKREFFKSLFTKAKGPIGGR
jgi:hypothetical protein